MVILSKVRFFVLTFANALVLSGDIVETLSEVVNGKLLESAIQIIFAFA